MSDRGGGPAVRVEIDGVNIVARPKGNPVAQCDREMRYVWVNDAFAEMLGRPRDEIVGRRMPDVLGPRASEILAPAVARVLLGEEVELEGVARLADGDVRVLRVTYLPTRDVSGEPSGWVATLHDVTAQAASDEVRSRLAAIIENSDDAIVSKTLDGIVTSWNEGARRLFGYAPEEMIGQPIQRIMPPDRVDDMLHILGRIRAGERVDHFVTERLHKDGTRVEVSLTVSPIRDGSGRVVGVSKIARDVTASQRAEEAMRDTLRLVSTLNRTSVVLSSELDMTRLVQEVTDAATQAVGARYGAFFSNVADDDGQRYLLHAVSGAPAEAFASFPMPRSAAVFTRTFRSEGVVRLDDVRVDPRYGSNAPLAGTPPGHLRVVSYLAAPVVRRGEVLGGLFFGHPEPGVFSERDARLLVGIVAQAAIAMDNARLYAAERKARDEAESASRAKDELLSIVSHELRTPLSSMLSWLAVLRQGKLSPERTQRVLETIERNGRVQSELINDLLDVSRIVSGRLVLQLAAVDVRAVVAAALESIRPDAAAKGIEISVSDAADVTVQGDEVRLQQVVSNLLANAVKFTPPGRSVAVSLARDQDAARLVVCDEGEGIAAEFLPHVFEPFRQAEDVRKRKSGGLGLGLTIVQRLVEEHGGTVAVDSAGPGRGAAFTVTLPLATSEA